ncbi:2-keto-4-pentenoate hydratase [Nocardia carnea]|uniref:2-keto-4-pentenoate hydratase n=1 Tax=Nocardia carnea TaxID=37328 RepID=UPI002455266B|nr:4-oxalocrotonate decarboxylase [Nocardia carnea]
MTNSTTASPGDIEALARRLDNAQRTRADTPSLEGDASLGVDLDVDTAYLVQEALVGLRTMRGETVVGVKLGFTSKAKMAQMGVSDVIVGRITDAMQVADGGETDLRGYIHPKVEPEVAYRIGRDITLADLDDPDTDIVACADAIAPALEIIDSRYRDFRFTYADVVADNTSAAGFAVGTWRPMREAADRAVRLRVGDEQTTGTTAAILGDPQAALHALLGMCRRRRIPLHAGYVVLAGAATAAMPLTEATVECEIAGIGTVSLTGVRR